MSKFPEINNFFKNIISQKRQTNHIFHLSSLIFHHKTPFFLIFTSQRPTIHSPPSQGGIGGESCTTLHFYSALHCIATAPKLHCNTAYIREQYSALQHPNTVLHYNLV